MRRCYRYHHGNFDDDSQHNDHCVDNYRFYRYERDGNLGHHGHHSNRNIHNIDLDYDCDERDGDLGHHRHHSDRDIRHSDLDHDRDERDLGNDRADRDISNCDQHDDHLCSHHFHQHASTIMPAWYHRPICAPPDDEVARPGGT